MIRAMTYMAVAMTAGAVTLGVGALKTWLSGASMAENYAITVAFLGGVLVAGFFVYYRERDPPSRRTKVAFVAVEYSLVASMVYFQFLI